MNKPACSSEAESKTSSQRSYVRASSLVMETETGKVSPTYAGGAKDTSTLMR